MLYWHRLRTFGIRLTRFIHPDPKDVSLDAVLHALADPARRAIVKALAAEKNRTRGLTCTQAAPANLAKSTMSHHYTVLRAAGLVRAKKTGVAVFHTLRRQEIETRFPGVLSAILAADG